MSSQQRSSMFKLLAHQKHVETIQDGRALWKLMFLLVCVATVDGRNQVK